MGRHYRHSIGLAAVGVLGLVTAVTGVLQAHAAGTPGNVFVSPTGDDGNPGSQAAPVRTLPRDQAEAVMLRVVAGLDVAQTAQVLGKRAGAVRVAAMRGLRRLANHPEVVARVAGHPAAERRPVDSAQPEGV